MSTIDKEAYEAWLKEFKVSSQYVKSQPKPLGFYKNFDNGREKTIENKNNIQCVWNSQTRTIQ